jgi:hypothetical protein
MSATDSTRTTASASNVLYWSGLALIGAVVVAGLARPLLTLTRFVPLDPNEGWNAFFDQVAMQGGDLYPPPGSPIINNYPPLSFYIVGLLGRLTGDNVYAGRFVALASMAIVAVNVYGWLRASGSATRVAWLGAGLFAAFAVTWGQYYVGMNDPQWLAHAIMTTGVVVIWRGNAGTRAILWGSLLILAGGWTKHLLIPLPIATTWWLMRRSKSAFMTWMVSSSLLLALIALCVWWLYGPAFFESLPSARAYSVHQAIKESRKVLKVFAPIIALSVLLVPRALRSERNEFALVYLLTAAVVAFAASGGYGVDINAFFDLMIAASLCAALSVEELWPRRLPAPARWVEFGPALALLLGAYLGHYEARLMPKSWAEIRNLDALERQTRSDVRLIAEKGHGRAACETPDLCYWAHQQFTFDYFNFGQRLIVGKEPMTECDSIFDGIRLPLVQLEHNKFGFGTGQLPPACNAAIRRNYRLISTSIIGFVFAPSH